MPDKLKFILGAFLLSTAIVTAGGFFNKILERRSTKICNEKRTQDLYYKIETIAKQGDFKDIQIGHIFTYYTKERPTLKIEYTAINGLLPARYYSIEEEVYPNQWVKIFSGGKPSSKPTQPLSTVLETRLNRLYEQRTETLKEYYFL